MNSDRVQVVRHSPNPATDDAAAVLRALATEPRAVVYDATTRDQAHHNVSAVFDALARYLAFCPGTALLVCTVDPVVVAVLRSHPLAAYVSIWARPDDALAAATLMPPIDRHLLELDPDLGAPRQARGLVRQALAGWEIPHLVGPAWSVITELVTNAVIHAATPLTASISRAGEHSGAVRLAVRDGASAMPMLLTPTQPPSSGGLGIWLVSELTRGWGVVPLNPGKIVWAALDGSIPSAPAGTSPE